MKKIKILVFVQCLLLVSFFTVGCSFGKHDNNEFTIEVSNLSTKVVEFDDYINNKNNISKLPEYTGELLYGDNYVLISTLDFKSTKDNDGTSFLTYVLTFENISVAEGHIFESNSGQYEDIPFVDSNGLSGKTARLSKRASEKAGEVTHLTMVMTLSILKATNSTYRIDFETNGVEVSGEDCDGGIKTMRIIKQKIDNPKISFNRGQSTLIWKHAKGADFYKIILDGEVYKFRGEDFIFETSNIYDVGSEIVLDLSKYDITGRHNLQIKAFSNDANFLPSNLSNLTEITI